MKWLLLLFLPLAVWLGAYLEEQRQERFSRECASNLRNLGTALEMYSTDYSGHYPPHLSLLPPTYIDHLPECPRAGTFTYSYSFGTTPDAYTMVCRGGHPVR